ncbi:hypothetical protein KIW84_054407 [Lathyrus oleraceus]|uniref:Uncharacterized protein n=1 Tax=Pisum sativum TaxID=3888 RepID=A0A9D5AEG6_PEA|nr:hypothetical protein KIW84_054407 [Pisum sativum]
MGIFLQRFCQRDGIFSSFSLAAIGVATKSNEALGRSPLSIGFYVALIMATLYTIPEATGSAAITRVSNALGDGHPQAARLSMYASMTLAPDLLWCELCLVAGHWLGNAILLKAFVAY